MRKSGISNVFSVLMSKVRRGCVMLGLGAAAVVLAGCHGSRGLEPFEIPDQLDMNKNYTITFWAKNDTNRTQTEIYEQAIADFETYYPNITVNLRLYTNYGDIYNDVITNISTNTTPNVCISYPDHIATYLTGSNIVVPLDELFRDADYGLGGREIRYDSVREDEIVPRYLSEGYIDGTCYAIPFMRSTEACYVNKTYVEALGYPLPDILTWDFVWEVSEAALKTDADGNYLVNGQNVLIPFIYKSTDNMMIQMLKQKGGGYSTDAGEIRIFNDTTKELLYVIAEHGKSKAFSTFKISSYPANFLNAGQCIFAVDSTAGSTWMGSDAPLVDISEDKLVQFETAVRMVPQFDPQNPQMISQGPSICLFNKEDPEEVLASWIFAQYLLTNEVQIPYAQTEGYIPVTLKAQNSDGYADYLARGGEDNALHYSIKLEATRLLLDHVEDTFVTPVFNGSASLRDAAGQMIENVVKSVRRGKAVDDDYLDELYSDVTSLYRLGQGKASGSQADLEPLPRESVLLLAVLAGIWIILLVTAIFRAIKANRMEKL